jgi:hypothetical protein
MAFIATAVKSAKAGGVWTRMEDTEKQSARKVES